MHPKQFYAVCTAAFIVMIVYGSLYPFIFHNGLHPLGPFQTLISSWRVPDSRADIAENILLYMPLGLSLYALARGSDFARLALAVFGGFSLSVAVEITQYYDLGRDTSLSDVCSNTAGGLAGAAAGLLLRRYSTGRLTGLRRRPYGALLLSCWLGFQLFPLIHTQGLGQFENSLRFMATFPTIPLSAAYQSFANWLAVAILIEGVFEVRSSRAVIILFSVILAAKFIFMNHSPSSADLTGGVAAVAIWTVFLSRLRLRTQVTSVIFLGAVMLLEWAPGWGGPPAFNWVPMSNFLNASISFAVPAFLAKTFAYGTLVWLAVRAGIPFAISVSLGSILLLGLNVAQIHFDKRSADITDVLLFLTLAVGMKLIQMQAPRTPPVAI